MENTYYIQTWFDHYDRDQGFMEEEEVRDKTLDQVKAQVESFYKEFVKESRGSMEIIDGDYNSLFHISEDSDHLLKEIE
jgi:hypothetical protein